MEPFAYVPLVKALQVLSAVAIVLLMMIFAIIYMSRKRGERIERKLDAIGKRLGIQDHFAHLDEEHGRKSLYASLDFDHSHGALQAMQDDWEGGSSRKFAPPVTKTRATPGAHGFTPPPPPPPRPRE